MDRIAETIVKVAPLFGMLAAGYFFKRRSILGPDTVAGIKTLVAKLTLPAVVFGAFSAVRLDKAAAVTFVAIFIALAIAFGIALGLEALGGKKSPRPFLMTAFEAGMLGFPLFGILYGLDKIPRMAIADLGEIFFTFFILIPFMDIRSGGKRGLGPIFHRIVRNPVIWAVILGLASAAFGLGGFFTGTLGGRVISTSIAFAAAPTGFLILFVVGYNLDFSRKKLGWALPTILLRYVVMVPLLFAAKFVIGAFGGSGVDSYLILAVTVLFIMPPSFAISIFSRGEDSEYISTTISLNTLITVILLFALTFI
ncbi:MAG TPA: AEC family transporter [Rectinemataceae bacterium]|nr:AEC family transporter [Rectinemataceae bacterium]